MSLLLFCTLFSDTQPPVIKSCPDDIYIFEDEEPLFERPVFSDNVGIMYTYIPDIDSPLSVGTYPQEVYVKDWDLNYAYCYFSVYVSARGNHNLVYHTTHLLFNVRITVVHISHTFSMTNYYIVVQTN